jgi:hypothetical protein
MSDETEASDNPSAEPISIGLRFTVVDTATTLAKTRPTKLDIPRAPHTFAFANQLIARTNLSTFQPTLALDTPPSTRLAALD